MFKPFDTALPLAGTSTAQSELELEFGDRATFTPPQINLVAADLSDDAIFSEIMQIVAATAAYEVASSMGFGHAHSCACSACDTESEDDGYAPSSDYKSQILQIGNALRTAILDGDVDGSMSSMVAFVSNLTGLETDFLTEKVIGSLADLSAPTGPTPLEMGDSVAGDSSTTAVIEVGGRANGTTETNGEQDWYRVDLEAGVEYAFIMLRAEGSPHGDPLLRLFGTDGTTEVAMNDDADAGGNGAGQSSLFTFTPSTSGTYFLAADGWEDPNGVFQSVGDYVLFVEPDNGRPSFSIEEAAFFLTDGFSPRSTWEDTNITYNLDGIAAGVQALVIRAFDAWAELAPFTFTSASLADADIFFTNDDEGAYASSSTNSNGFYISGTRVNIEADWDQNGTDVSSFTYDVNSYLYQTVVHEIGHALGLGHGGPYNSAADYGTNNVYAEDSWNQTVMSYFDQGEAGQGTSRLALGPQVADVTAIQNLYGINTTTRSGDTVYGFNSTESAESLYNFLAFSQAGTRPPTISIFDTGGNDTIDLSFYDADQTVSLIPGTFSSVGDNTQIFPVRALDNVISISLGTIIENVVGGGGDDTLIGNDADNVFTGRGGDDEIFGGDGDDVAVFRQDQEDYTITENADGSWTVEQSRNDGEDTLVDVEVLRFRDGDLRIIDAPVVGPNPPVFTQEADNQTGLDTDEVLNGLSGDDIINGGGGNDTVLGSFGNDTLDGGAGNDLVQGDEAYALGNIEGEVFRAYQAVFDRAPDIGGFTAFRNAIVGDALTQEAVIEEFVNSAEFELTYGNLSNQAFVEQLYRNVLDREGDAGGIAAFTGALNGETLSRAEVVIEFANSPEFITTSTLKSAAFATSANVDPIEAQVFRVYQAVLNRAPDDAGFLAFTGAVKGGALTLNQVLEQFVNSAEFDLTYGELSNSDFVSLLYQNVLGRDADAEGLAAFTGALDGDALTRAQVVAEFSESAEFIFLTDAAAKAFAASADVFASDTLIDSDGDDIYFGGEGQDTFLFSGNSNDIDTILDFTVGVDVVEISNVSAISSFAALVAASTQVGNDVVIDLGGGRSLILANFQVSDMVESQFTVTGTVSQDAPASAVVLDPLADFGTDGLTDTGAVEVYAAAVEQDVAAEFSLDMLFEPDYDYGL